MFAALQRRRAARRYAAQLPAALRKGYGASEFYTPAQIRAAATKAGLSPEHLAIGFAMYLPEETFREVSAGDYQELRALFLRYRSLSPAYGSDPPRENTDAIAWQNPTPGQLG